MLTERQSEALRYDISLCVTAGAGTGKTHVLVNRYIRLIEEAGCRPSEILALTFTDKAASEMKERVEKEIFLKSGPFWEQVKEEMMWANISTFHSFCSKILREFSIEAGIEPGFSVLSDNESEEIIAGALSSLFGSTPENSVKESLENCLCAYGTYYLEMFLRELHRQRRYSDEFFEKLETDDDTIVNEWKSALLYEKTGIASEFKNS
ncbi:MAG: UvrD-helicase domain-containing protein, partial [Methanomicrobium sp.]|nr:UvrD-helicase domain-containing protein [Methanomicrobium sp.]